MGLKSYSCLISIWPLSKVFRWWWSVQINHKSFAGQFDVNNGRPVRIALRPTSDQKTGFQLTTGGHHGTNQWIWIGWQWNGYIKSDPKPDPNPDLNSGAARLRSSASEFTNVVTGENFSRLNDSTVLVWLGLWVSFISWSIFTRVIEFTISSSVGKLVFALAPQNPRAAVS